jgi:hypothetical protein
MAATIRKFVTIKPKFGSDDLGKQYKSQMFAFNRLGVVLTDIGLLTKEFKEVVTTYTDSVTAFQEREREVTEKEHKHKVDIIEAQEDMLGKKKGLQQDKLAEEKQEGLSNKQEEKTGEEEAKKEKKGKFGWLKNLLSPMKMLMGGLVKLVAPFLALGVLDWLSKPENLQKIKTLLKFFKGIWDLARWFTKWGMTQVLDGLTKVFGNDPNKNAVENGLDKVFGVLQIVAGLASIFIGSRILMPWKLIGDFKAMRKIGEAFRKGTSPRSRGGGGGGGSRDRSGRRLTARERYKRRFGDRAARRRFGRGGRRGLRGVAGALCPNPLDLLPAGADDATKKAVAQNADEVVKKTGVEIAEQSSKKVATEAAEEVATSKGVMGALGDLFGKGQRLAGRAVDATVSGAKAVGSFTVGAFQNLNKWFAEGGERLIGGVKSLGQGIWDFGAKAGKAIGDVAELAKNPAALRDKAMAKVKDFVGPLLEKNPIGKQVKDLANSPPKGPLGGIKMDKIKDSIGGALKAGFQNPGFKNMREFLKAAKANAKIGGIDKIVALVMALMDYGMFGESPINALLKATGGLLGYSAGFAIGAPFGGVPGFITGMAGGFAGEWAAEQLLKLLYKIPWLAETDDPIAKMIGGDFAQRKLIRDPDGGFPGEDALMSAAESGDPGEPMTLPEMAVGGAVRAHNKMAKKMVDPMVMSTKKAAKDPARDWGKFASGGSVNGKLPEDQLASIGGGHKLAKDVAPKFKAMMAKAADDGFKMGSAFRINSSYRSYEKQAELYNSLGPGTAAAPGTSNHGLGKAVDLWFTNGAYKWLRMNAGTYGFKQIPGYETDNPDGHEAWHWENLTGGGSVDGSGNYTAPTTGSTTQTGTDSSSSNTGGTDTSNQTAEPTVDAKTEYLSAQKMAEFFAQKLGIFGNYAKDADEMGSGTPSAGVFDPTPPQAPPSVAPPAPQSPTPASDLKPVKTDETEAINTKIDKLSTLSVDKTRREKEPKTNQLMVAVQPVVQTQVMGGGKKQSAGGPSASPLLNG